MPKIITFVPSDNISHTRSIVDALGRCHGIGDYLLLVRMNPGNHDLVAMIKRIRFAKVIINVASKKFTLGHNTHIVWRQAFNETNFIVHIAANMAPTSDCLKYMEYCNQAYYDDPEVFSVSSYNPANCDPARAHLVTRRAEFMGGIVGFWKNRWVLTGYRWHDNMNKYALLLNEIMAERDMKEVYPLLSRSRKITTRHTAATVSNQKFRGETDDFSAAVYRDCVPLVTAAMITGGQKQRYSLARVAIDCFKNQTYPNKELLIINHGEESLFDGDAHITEIRVKKRNSWKVGDLRNLALKHAAGEYITNWDDDDWHHPERIAVQMDAQEYDAAVFLKNRIAYNFKNGCARYLKDANGAEATILHPKNVDFRYPSLVRQSDTVFASSFQNRIAINNNPALFLRFYHGLNLWNASHIMSHLADPNVKNRLEIDAEHKDLLKRVLPLYPEWNNLSTTATDGLRTSSAVD